MQLDNSIEQFTDDIEWIKSLPLYLEYPDFKTKDNRYLVVSHSCVDDTWSIKDSDDEFDKEDFKTKVLYSRNKKPFENKNLFNVFGHTPTEEAIIESYCANIDTGAYYKEEYGYLTALEFPAMNLITQKNIELY
jgi:serine/threonine protein phosphatase 1